MAEVYFLKLTPQTPQSLKKAGEKISQLFGKFFNSKDKVAIKVHFGERNSQTFLNPILVRAIYNQLKNKVQKAALMDCTVLYKSERSLGSTHQRLAKEHGFGFAPILIADGEKGERELIVEVKQKHFQEVKLGGALKDFNSLLAITHFTGHGGTGFGGALKNVGMGLASKGGKLELHQAFRLTINPLVCQGCWVCWRECPGEAIFKDNGKAKIDSQKCLGCGMCIAVCPYGAVQIPFGEQSSADLQEKIGEYVFGVLKGRKAFFINVLLNITPNCDCHRAVQEAMVPDIGLLASGDIVAIDQASVDLVGKKNLERPSVPDPLAQIEYAEKLGLGEKDYQLREMSD